MEEKKNLMELKKDQMEKTKAGTTAILCSACVKYVWDGIRWTRICDWTGLPGGGCGFESNA